MKKSILIVLLMVMALGVFAAFGSSGLGDRIELPPVQCATAVDRRETLAALRSAWAERPREHSEANRKAERLFLNRILSFLRRTQQHENFAPTAQLWNECYSAHAEQYGDFIKDH